MTHKYPKTIIPTLPLVESNFEAQLPPLCIILAEACIGLCNIMFYDLRLFYDRRDRKSHLKRPRRVQEGVQREKEKGEEAGKRHQKSRCINSLYPFPFSVSEGSCFSCL